MNLPFIKVIIECHFLKWIQFPLAVDSDNQVTKNS